MRFTVQLTFRARQEVRDLRHYYEEARPGLGRRFAETVDAALERVGDNPHAYQVVHRDLRRALAGRFPYGIFYRVSETTVTVLAVLHLHRDPETWRSL